MSTRSKTMGAALASSTQSGVNINMNTAGGDKKQGIPSRVGLDNWANLAVQTEANGSVTGRSTIFYMNQLGGVGRGKSQFSVAGTYVQKRGAKRKLPMVFQN
jgi:hypothetical protein